MWWWNNRRKRSHVSPVWSAAESLMVHTRRNAATLTRYPRVTVIICICGQAVLAGQLRGESSVLCQSVVIGDENRIEGGKSIWCAHIFPRRLGRRRTRIVKSNAQSLCA